VTRDEEIQKIRADEPGTAGDKDFHGAIQVKPYLNPGDFPRLSNAPLVGPAW
jgi:hypothetical protein